MYYVFLRKKTLGRCPGTGYSKEADPTNFYVVGQVFVKKM
jgi:hypothetical protein